MKSIFASALAAVVVGAADRNPPTPLGHVVEGVYFQKKMFQTTIVELKGGNFRYWFSSDMKFGQEPTYPQTGKYTSTGGVVKVVVSRGTFGFVINGVTNKNEFFITNQWTFMTHQEKPTLWRPDALKSWEEDMTVSGYGVLFQTEKKPEEIWRVLEGK